MVLNQCEERLTPIKESTAKILERRGIAKNALTNFTEVLVNCYLKLVTNGLGSFNVDAKH